MVTKPLFETDVPWGLRLEAAGMSGVDRPAHIYASA
jgi:hypothetical protein